MSQISEQVRSISADIFQIPAEKVTLESSPETVETWDSVQHLNLILALEERFGIQFEPEETEDMKSVGAIAELVRRKVRQ
jgi:acyl carrier protein